MKAKTLMGMIACASACVSLSAFGNTTNGWFGVTVENNEIAPSNCATNGVEVTIDANNKIVLDNDSDSPFVVTNFASAATSDNIVKITATALLTPNATNDLSESVSGGAKAGFAVGIDDNNATNFYGYANGEWHQLSGQADNYDWDSDTTFSMILNYRDKVVSFYVGDVLLNSADSLQLASTATGLNAIDAYGSGSITSITGAYEVAVAAYEVEENVYKKYGSIAEAVTAAKKDSKDATSVQAVTDSGVLLPANETASNGLNLVVCEAMGLPTDKDTDEATIKLESATKSHADKITLAWKKPQSADNGVTVKFQVKKNGVDEGEACDWDDIQIPMESGTYTIEPSIQ